MANRTVGQGRGSVFAPDGRVYLEGDTIPDDVEVGAHIFTAVGSRAAVRAEARAAAEPVDVDGKVDDVLAEVGDDPVKAQAALDAERKKGDKARSSLVDKLNTIIDEAS